jgi:hypothetical protein
LNDYGYATNSAGWIQDPGPVMLWSPDSKKIATFRQDSRNVGTLTLTETAVGHGRVDTWKYPLPGDEHVFMLERVVIHAESDSASQPVLVRLDLPPEPQRSTTTDHIAGRNGEFLDVRWSDDSQTLAFISSSRDHKVAQLRVADSDTGVVRDVYREESKTYYESGLDAENWALLETSDEFLWFSESSDWGHLYLGDLASGKIKRQISSGEWAVQQVLVGRSRHAAGAIYGGSIVSPETLIFSRFIDLSLDGGEPVLLTPESAHHRVDFAQSERYFLDTLLDAHNGTRKRYSKRRRRTGDAAGESSTRWAESGGLGRARAFRHQGAGWANRDSWAAL